MHLTMRRENFVTNASVLTVPDNDTLTEGYVYYLSIGNS